MFRRSTEPGPDAVTVLVEGRPVRVAAGESAAAAALAAGLIHTRETAISKSPRAPWCMMGVCFECLMDIDGEPNHQACLTVVRDGMIIKRQHGAHELDVPPPLDGESGQ